MGIPRVRRNNRRQTDSGSPPILNNRGLLDPNPAIIVLDGTVRISFTLMPDFSSIPLQLLGLPIIWLMDSSFVLHPIVGCVASSTTSLDCDFGVVPAVGDYIWVGPNNNNIVVGGSFLPTESLAIIT